MSSYTETEQGRISSWRDDYKVSLSPVLRNINLPTVIKTTIFPGEKYESLVVATQVGEIIKVDSQSRSTILDLRNKIGTLGLSSEITFDQRGLTGLEFHPDFKTNGLFYIYYSSPNSKTGDVPSTPIDPCLPDTLKQVWLNENIYDHLNILEEWQYCHCQNCKQSDKVHYLKTLLQIKQPFFNHNGINNLTWDPDYDFLTLTLGDGGSNYDPFNLAQNDLYPHGKILSVRPNLITQECSPISRLTELNSEQQQAIEILVRGIRDAQGVALQRWETRHIRYTAHRGQTVKESIQAYHDYHNNQGCPNNLGWRAWEGSWPTTTPNDCPNQEFGIISCKEINSIQYNPSQEFGIISRKEINSIQCNPSPEFGIISGERSPTVHTFHWNLKTNYGPIFEVNQGDSIHFVSTDGLNHTLDISTGPSRWLPTKQLVSVTNNLNFVTDPLNNTGTIFFICLIHQQIMRLTVLVNSYPDESINDNLDSYSKNSMLLYTMTFPKEALTPGYPPCISYIGLSFLTGLTSYEGSKIPFMQGSMIFTDWEGSLMMAHPDPHNLNQEVEFQQIEVFNSECNQPQYYVCLGSNNTHSRIFIGVYNSMGVADLGLGAVYEIVPC